MKATFRTVLQPFGPSTGIEVPAKQVAALGPRKRPPVVVTVSGYRYRSTISPMGGRFYLPFARVHRDASGLKQGAAIQVTLELDTTERTVEIPPALRKALKAGGVIGAFEALSYTKRKEACTAVTQAKRSETKAQRIEKIVNELRGK